MGIPISKATNVEKNACLTVNFSALKMYLTKTLFEVSKLEKEEFEKSSFVKRGKIENTKGITKAQITRKTIKIEIPDKICLSKSFLEKELFSIV
jgi:hypothetical protein